jgi:tetratricopeptide (TPR) repeat protein
VETAFDDANALYAGNKFTEAATAYERILSTNGVSAPLLFNLGNAHFKAGQVGRAVAAYHRAEALSPRDSDLRANLQFVRNQVQGPTLRPTFVERSVGFLSVNEWAVLSAGALWILCGLLALRQIKPALGSALRQLTRAAFCVTVILAGALAASTHFRAPSRTVIICAKEVAVRISPNDEARQAFLANDGAELLLMDSKNGWVQIGDGGPKHYGWVKETQIAAAR